MKNYGFVGYSLQLYPETMEAIAFTDAQCILFSETMTFIQLVDLFSFEINDTNKKSNNSSR